MTQFDLVKGPVPSMLSQPTLEYVNQVRSKKRSPIIVKDTAEFVRVGDGITITDVLDYAKEEDVQHIFQWWGPKGAGKTNGLGWLLMYVYRDWEKVVDHIVYRWDDLKQLLKEYEEKGEVCPVVGLDDAGIHFSAYQWSDRDLKIFANWLKGAREFVKVIIFTTPRPNDVISILRYHSTGEVFSFDKGEAEFYLYDWRIDFERPNTAYFRKIPIHSRYYGTVFTYPKIPSEVEERIRKKKILALKINQAKELEKIVNLKNFRELDSQILRIEKRLLRLFNPDTSMSVPEIKEKLNKTIPDVSSYSNKVINDIVVRLMSLGLLAVSPKRSHHLDSYVLTAKGIAYLNMLDEIEKTGLDTTELMNKVSK